MELSFARARVPRSDAAGRLLDSHRRAACQAPNEHPPRSARECSYALNSSFGTNQRQSAPAQHEPSALTRRQALPRLFLTSDIAAAQRKRSEDRTLHPALQLLRRGPFRQAPPSGAGTSDSSEIRGCGGKTYKEGCLGEQRTRKLKGDQEEE